MIIIFKVMLCNLIICGKYLLCVNHLTFRSGKLCGAITIRFFMNHMTSATVFAGERATIRRKLFRLLINFALCAGIIRQTFADLVIGCIDSACAAIFAKVSATLSFALSSPIAVIAVTTWVARPKFALSVTAAKTFARAILTSNALEFFYAFASCISEMIFLTNAIIFAVQLIAMLALGPSESDLTNARFIAIFCCTCPIIARSSAVNDSHFAAITCPRIRAFAF